MSSENEDNTAMDVYANILNENIGKTLFIEYLENNNSYIQPFEVLEKASNYKIQVKRLYDNTTITKDLSVINCLTVLNEERTQACLETYLNTDKLLSEPAYQMILSGTDEYNTFHERKFLSSNGCRVPIESIYLSVKLGYNNYDEILSADVEDLKTRWSALINEHKNKAVQLLTEEKTASDNAGNTEDAEEIEVILSLLNDLTDEINEELADLTDNQSILTYWPPLLLPAPSYLHT